MPRPATQVRAGTAPADTLAYRIVTCFGGYVRLAQMLGIPPRRVRAWFLHGIPAEYHIDLLKLSLPLEDADIVTVENLEQTRFGGQLYRARRAQAVERSMGTWVAARSTRISVR